ncbi:Hypothetical protein EHI5A_160910 [Entamoeba histolytica KU27]|uniref:Uncharacterized protein n=1 Tax=Entamoeba histolytica KU27 TaxID=885311 RepID=M2R6T8_ENTHI|nr:Hypothetical protein EHI5A_160910 [Entamoeba histolytica KU27]
MLTKHSNTERRSETAYLREHYPQSLVQFHKIGVKLQNAPEKENEVVVEPDVHFQIDGKEYLVFFNNHLREINKILNRWLEIEFSEHGFIMSDIVKSDIRCIADTGKPNTKNRVLKTFIPGYGQYQGIRSWCNTVARMVSSESQEDNDRIVRIAYHVYQTKKLIEKYGSEIRSGKICAICIEKNFNGKSNYIINCDEELYQKLESKLFETMSSYKNIDEKFNTLTNFLYWSRKKVQPSVDEWRRMLFFVLVINRVNYYLTREEELLIDKSYRRN